MGTNTHTNTTNPEKLSALRLCSRVVAAMHNTSGQNGNEGCSAQDQLGDMQGSAVRVWNRAPANDGFRIAWIIMYKRLLILVCTFKWILKRI